MYSFIEGNLEFLHPSSVVVNCNGVGFFVQISVNTFSKIKDKAKSRLYIHQVVRDDAILLYGFFDIEERDMFQLLITVSGVGPNTARLILSSLTPVEVQEAVSGGNVALLQSVKGIGAKTASRIIVDLKDKVGKNLASDGILPIQHNTTRQESLFALIALGYNKAEAERAISKVMKENAEVLQIDKFIKEALKHLIKSQ